MLSPIRVSGRPVRSDRRTSRRVVRIVPRRPMASKSALRRSTVNGGTFEPSSPSGAQLGAPLRPAAGKHAATTLRSHASAEAMFPLPGALLGLIGPFHRSRAVLRSAAASEGPQTYERLATSPASRDGLWSARLALPGDSTDARRGVSNTLRAPARAVRGRFSHSVAKSIAGSERLLLHYRDPRGPTPSDRVPRAPRETSKSPREPRSIGWETAIDGCEAGLACRPR